MPLHEFTCKSCAHAFEELLFGSEQAACPKCGSRALDRRPSTFAVNAPSSGGGNDIGACGTCGDPRGPGACSMN